jgi:ribosomal protein L35AE/L33A
MAEMHGVIAGFARGKRHEDPRAAILHVRSVTSREAAGKLLGRTVLFKRTDGLEWRGQVHAVHGNGGAVIARFRRQLPPADFPIQVKVL